MKPLFTAFLLCLTLLVGCGRQESGDADLPEVQQRWEGLSEEYRISVCVHATPSPDYREMLHALMGAGYGQEDATEMLPYAAEDCT